jgi:valyl-tRNA synthetase
MPMSNPMPSAFDPQAIEAGWYARWEEANLFRADATSPKPHYTIAVPPPNVTGELHMGHATIASVQDLVSRYKRMTGFEVLWLPGYDHAAIATQNVIEKQLAREGTSKEELGRAAFNERVERWYAEVGGTIISQFRELGASLDWSRTRFTMDAAYVRAVLTAFVRFYEKGWLYRGPRIVNWCPNNLSAISDLEVQWKEHKDTLYFVRYPVDGGGEVVIATVRPETMLADTGVAVNPTDKRYAGLVGRTAILPLVNRRLPIVGDDAVEMEFGTGALKVTPGHDPMDYEIGQRHGLELISAMHPDGRMNTPFAPDYDGLPSLQARERVVADLQKGGFLIKTEPYVHEVGHCDRCDAVIEPLISEQWFLNMKELAAGAIEASEQGRVRWHPERYERTYLDWLRGIRDWCVSRQLWLGHRIPVFTCPNRHTFAAVDPPDACQECGAAPLEQDPDVLDTWFSSALWPFATLGWPEDTEDLRAFYPTSLNTTAREIINLWVSRMIMTGLHFMGDVPFRDVAIQAVIQAADGRRMSKSLGTGVDPRQMIRKYGADALRAWCAQVAMSTQDVRFDESRIEGYRRFANKLWNATRLVLGSLGAEPVAVPAPDADLALEDRWILSRLEQCTRRVNEGIEGYSFQISIESLYAFVWNEFCDWYLEAVKSRLKDGDPAARAVCVEVLDVSLRMLHPIMPFVTEELWHRLPGQRGFVMRENWPQVEGYEDAEVEADFALVIRAVEEIRSARKAAGAPDRGGRLLVEDSRLDSHAELIGILARLELVPELSGPGVPLAEIAARAQFPRAQAADGGRQGAELSRLRKELEKVEAKLANLEFKRRAPADVVAREEQKAAELKAAIERLS